METDITTLHDLNAFGKDHTPSLFDKLNFCKTAVGEESLREALLQPLHSAEAIRETQQILKQIIRKKNAWPDCITNGGLLMIEKFYESPVETIPESPTTADAISYRLFHKSDFSLIQFSCIHFFDLLRGLHEISSLCKEEPLPETLAAVINEINHHLNQTLCKQFIAHDKREEISPKMTLIAGHFFLYRFRMPVKRLMALFGKLEAWHAMAMAVEHHQLCFPDIISSGETELAAEGLTHLLLEDPVPYDVRLDSHKNFMFLTGANMAGKSTFIKSVGAAVYLAHLGMGVPAKKMRVSLFDGLLSNINISDDLTRGESYFYNEVQRIKSTIQKAGDGRRWLILIDELFKGTNVEDAMKCSTLVIEGLVKIPKSLFILSTHLYEIADNLKKYPQISFHYFETRFTDNQFSFSYQLKEGVSNDKLGYLILKREGVVSMLERLVGDL